MKMWIKTLTKKWKKNNENEDKNNDIKNIMNLDSAQYNNLLEALVQNKNFMKEFLSWAQTSLLGQKTKEIKELKK